ncbi:MAG: hypothetical protein HOP21_02965 [Methylotenera sp.]|nr:hypothetical protein [Methylotenera sp.]
MTKLQHELLMACSSLSLEIILDYKLELPLSKAVLSVAFIPNLGDVNGILIFTKYDPTITKELIENGYAYSVLEELSLESVYDLDSYIEMFKDWGYKPKKYG